MNMSKTHSCVKKHEGFEFENDTTEFDFIDSFRNKTKEIPPSRPSVAKNSKIPYVNETKGVHAF